VVDLSVAGQLYWVIHGGIPCTARSLSAARERLVPFLAQHHAQELLWGYDQPEDMPPVDRPVIMGHMQRRAPLDAGHVIALDTGCGVFEDGYLTALLLPERRFVSSQ
jgi:hypothetical protein